MSTEMAFDATGVPPSSPMDPVPTGWYRVHIIESDVKPTANGNGKYLQLTLEILDGEYKGRKMWERLNIVNASAVAQEIAQKTLSAICHATGVMKLTNSAQLHHKPLMAKATVKHDKDREPNNEIKGYKSVDGAVTPITSTASAPTADAPVSDSAPAWAQKKAS